MTAVKDELSDDLEDEREGVKTYGRQARTFKRVDPVAAKSVKSIQSDEKRHARKLRTLRRSR